MAANTKKILDKTCISTTFLCEAFGVTRQAILKWEKKGCPKVARGWWCLADVLAWRDQQFSESEGKKVDDLPLTQQKTYWETRCKEEQAENQKFKNAILRGDYLQKSDIERDISTFLVVLKQAATGLSRRMAIVAGRYIGNEKARKMEIEAQEVIADALRQWSSGCFVESCGVDSAAPKNTKATGKNDRKRVGRQKPSTDAKVEQ